MTFRTNQIFTPNKGVGKVQPKHENGVRWGGGYKGPTLRKIVFVQPLACDSCHNHICQPPSAKRKTSVFFKQSYNWCFHYLNCREGKETHTHLHTSDLFRPATSSLELLCTGSISTRTVVQPHVMGKLKREDIWAKTVGRTD